MRVNKVSNTSNTQSTGKELLEYKRGTLTSTRILQMTSLLDTASPSNRLFSFLLPCYYMRSHHCVCVLLGETLIPCFTRGFMSSSTGLLNTRPCQVGHSQQLLTPAPQRHHKSETAWAADRGKVLQRSFPTANFTDPSLKPSSGRRKVVEKESPNQVRGEWQILHMNPHQETTLKHIPLYFSPLSTSNTLIVSF